MFLMHDKLFNKLQILAKQHCQLTTNLMNQQDNDLHGHTSHNCRGDKSISHNKHATR